MFFGKRLAGFSERFRSFFCHYKDFQNVSASFLSVNKRSETDGNAIIFKPIYSDSVYRIRHIP